MLFTHHTQHKVSKIILALSFAGALLMCGAHTADAASLYLKPGTTSVSAGSTLTLKVLVNSDGAYINSSDGTVQFPTDLLDVVGVSKTSSIFSVWIEEPAFSNAAGTVTFSGGLPSPGFIGGSGEVISITLKAKKSGTALITLSDGSVRANDGLGTDLLSSKLPATIQIGAYVAPAPKTTVVQKNSPPALPVITSLNQPKEDQWYKNNQVSFSWTVPSSVTLVQASVNTKSVAVPTVAYDGSVSSKTLNNLEDGVYYFNLRQQNDAGWGPTAHFKIQIDATAPNAFIPVIQENDTNHVVTLIATTTDDMSGVDYYTASLDGQPDIKIDTSIAKGGYVLPPQSEGDHTLVVTAFDKAGNTRVARTTFKSHGVVAPEVSLSSEEVQSGAGVIVSGTTLYPNTPVRISIQSGVGTVQTFDQTTGTDGSFKLALNDLKGTGSTAVWANIVFGDGKLSDPSKKVYFTVAGSKLMQTLTEYFYPILLITLILLLIAAFLFMLYLGWHKFFGLRKRLREDLQDTAAGIHKIMVTMKGELTRQLTALEKVKEDRDLNAKEQKIFKEIQGNIDDIDEFIQKKIKKIL